MNKMITVNPGILLKLCDGTGWRIAHMRVFLNVGIKPDAQVEIILDCELRHAGKTMSDIFKPQLVNLAIFENKLVPVGVRFRNVEIINADHAIQIAHDLVGDFVNKHKL